MQPSYRVVLDSYYDLSPSTRHFQFSREDGGPIHYVPGQFVKLGFPHRGEQLQRSFSIATLCEDIAHNTRLELAISYVEGGRGSEFFFQMQPGDSVDLYGPYGQLTLPEQLPAHLWLVATGTGICPYRAMLPTLRQRLRDADFRVDVLQGVRTRQELLYGEDFRHCQQDYPNLQFTACYSREPQLTEPGPHFLGYVTDYLAQVALDPQHDRIYLCGTPAMVDDGYQALKARGFGVKEVRREKYVFAVK